jgi:hypothetical protein
MATRVQDCRPGDRYLAGLWQSSLCFDLWYTDESAPTSDLDDAITRRIASCLDSVNSTPSWFWASTRGRAHWEWSETTEVLGCVKVIDIAYTIVGPEVSGEIQNAAITLRALLICFDCMRSRQGSEKSTIQHFQHQHQLGESHASHMTQYAANGELVYNHVRCDDIGIGPKSNHSGLFLLVVTWEDSNTSKSPSSLLSEDALVVRETEQSNRWIRLGKVLISLAGHANT